MKNYFNTHPYEHHANYIFEYRYTFFCSNLFASSKEKDFRTYYLCIICSLFIRHSFKSKMTNCSVNIFIPYATPRSRSRSRSPERTRSSSSHNRTQEWVIEHNHHDERNITDNDRSQLMDAAEHKDVVIGKADCS